MVKLQFSSAKSLSNKTNNINFFHFIANDQSQPEIRLQNTDTVIMGNVKPTIDNLTVWEFLGIPYAEAPNGDSRFRPAVTKKPFDSRTFNATRFGDICMQDINKIPEFKSWIQEQNIGMSEDCLSLNIWVPSGHNRYQFLDMVFM